MGSTAKHTAGPWHYSEDLSKHETALIYGPDGYLVADAGRIQKRTPEEREANARLMAASPDLFTALKEMVALYDDILKSNNIGKMCFQNYARLNEAPMLARQAIAKAEGAE